MILAPLFMLRIIWYTLCSKGGRVLPEVSVIVPVYKVEAFLPQCLDSILAQRFTDFELILVDDGSPDGSYAIMQEYAAKDYRIVLVRKQNGGLSSARNAGLDRASGKYIAFVDSDDWIDADLLMDAVAAGNAHQAELVLFNYRKFDQKKTEGAFLPMRDEVLKLDGNHLVRYFYRRWIPYIHGQEAWCRLYRRDVIEQNHLRFAPNDEIFAEDTLFSAMYLMHVTTLAALAKPYVYYRQREDSIMHKPRPRLARRMIELSARMTEYAEAAGKGDLLVNVLPILLYRLATKGIQNDPSDQDVWDALRTYRDHPTMRRLLRQLRGFSPLALYLWHTRKGYRTQVRGRMFAHAWLSGQLDRATRLAGRKRAS